MPESLERGEAPPRLPPYRELSAWPAHARLAIIYQMIHYLTEVVDGL